MIDHLHSAHQGVESMLFRAQATLYWPGISVDIENKRMNCHDCHRNAPSQAKLPPQSPQIPTVPFELIFGDYFKLNGKFFLVIGDRLSGWTEIISVKPSTCTSGSKGLCDALRRVFQTFGVPDEISSDGGREFISEEAVAFYDKWGVSHRLSSAYFPQSNGRAEVAVKTTKRLLEDNMNADGSLNNDSLVRALLQLRNTPDRDCRLSPAEILFGRTLKDALPRLDKSKMVFENTEVHDHWHKAWSAKEEAIRNRLVRSSEKLEEHAKELKPLLQGDTVFVQNQDPSSRDFKKWNRQGTIVSVGKYDQYLVKIHGTGRLTVRNRRFIRKYTLRSPYVSSENEAPRISSKDLLKSKKVSFAETGESTPLIPEQRIVHDPPVSLGPGDHTLEENVEVNPPVMLEDDAVGTKEVEEQNQVAQSQGPILSNDRNAGPQEKVQAEPNREMKPELRRSSRMRVPTKLYNPSSGT